MVKMGKCNETHISIEEPFHIKTYDIDLEPLEQELKLNQTRFFVVKLLK
jgi:hypothetical protein